MNCMNGKNSLVITLFAFFAFNVSSFVFAQETTTEVAKPSDFYEWKDTQVETGVMYHYVCSDIEGNAPQEIFLYFLDDQRIQALQNDYATKDGDSISLKTYTIDKDNFMFNKVEFDNLLPGTKNSYRNYLIEYSLADGKMIASGITIKNGQDKPLNATYNIPVTPSIFYTHMGIDIAVFFRFLKEGDFEYGLNFIDTLNSSHEMTIKYEKTEVVNDIPCKKYLLEGKGLLARISKRKSAVWLADDGGPEYLVKFTMNARRDWNYSNWMTLFVERTPMTVEEWESKQTEMVSDQKKLGKF